MLKIEYIFEHTGDVIDSRTCVVTQLQLLDIIDDVGTCWRELGLQLGISATKVRKLDEEYRSNRKKANALLLMWKQREGRSAVAGCLADALLSIGRKSIAEKLLGEYLLIVSVCMFVVLFNRSLRPVAPIFAWMINQITNPRLGCKVKRITTVNINWCLGEELLRIASFT